MQTGLSVGAGMLAAPLVARHALGADPIKVGSLLDLSGPIGASGQAMFDTIQLAVAEVNAGGGLLGRPVELVNYDTQSTIQLYSQYAQQLALRDKVAVVHGGITSASREAIRPVFDRYKTLYFYNVLYEGGVCDRNMFCTGTTPAQNI
ncbi:MAG: urea ABC transporter, partial [Lysobacteraceae bacterium]